MALGGNRPCPESQGLPWGTACPGESPLAAFLHSSSIQDGLALCLHICRVETTLSCPARNRTWVVPPSHLPHGPLKHCLAEGWRGVGLEAQWSPGMGTPQHAGDLLSGEPAASLGSVLAHASTESRLPVATTGFQGGSARGSNDLGPMDITS